MDPFKVMTLWSRIWTQTTSRPSLGEEPRPTLEGTRMSPCPQLSGHAGEREEDELEGRSKDSEEFRSKTRTETNSRPSLGEEPRPMLKGTRMSPDGYFLVGIISTQEIQGKVDICAHHRGQHTTQH